jgi:hypothetical protein
MLQDYPQCRGDGPTVIDALRAARQGYNHVLDCRASWMIQTAQSDGRDAMPSGGTVTIETKNANLDRA